MREIKFRAWHKEGAYMMPVEEIDFENKLINKSGVWRWFNELVIMQSTGLVDKNGVQIFEGDIVNHYWSNEVGESFCHKTVIKNPFDYKVNEAMHLIYADELEILGNIYENSDLLEV